MKSPRYCFLGVTRRERIFVCSWALLAALLSVFLVSQAMGDGGDPAPEHRRRQARPISLGTSGENPRLGCNSFGTLGALLKGPQPVPTVPEWGFLILTSGLFASGVLLLRRTHLRRVSLPFSALIVLSGVLYAQNLFAANERFFILSNNHVIALFNDGKLNDRITQPGAEWGDDCEEEWPPDPPCECEESDRVANLSDFQTLVFGTKGNLMDAAIAKIKPGAVKTDGTILDINAGAAGPPGTTPKAATVDLKVKKSGRTTGLTNGTVKLLDVTQTLASPKGNYKMVHQIKIGGAADTCISGDSGSLWVEDTSPCPAPVGLLHAGNADGSVCIATPIQTVLDRFNMEVVGCEAGGDSGLASGSGLELARSDALQDAIEVKQRWEEQLLSIPGVIGVGVGRSKTRPGELAIGVLCEYDSPELRSGVPTELEGIAVEIEVTGPISYLSQ